MRRVESAIGARGTITKRTFFPRGPRMGRGGGGAASPAVRRLRRRGGAGDPRRDDREDHAGCGGAAGFRRDDGVQRGRARPERQGDAERVRDLDRFGPRGVHRGGQRSYREGYGGRERRGHVDGDVRAGERHGVHHGRADAGEAGCRIRRRPGGPSGDGAGGAVGGARGGTDRRCHPRGHSHLRPGRRAQWFGKSERGCHGRGRAGVDDLDAGRRTPSEDDRHGRRAVKRIPGLRPGRPAHARLHARRRHRGQPVRSGRNGDGRAHDPHHESGRRSEFGTVHGPVHR